MFGFQVYVFPIVLWLQFYPGPRRPDRGLKARCGAQPLSSLLQFQQIQVFKPSQS